MDEKPESFILIQFAGLNSTVFGMKAVNVSAMQILMLSNYLEVDARRKLIQEMDAREAEERERNLAVPENKIIRARG
jgi:hypothetical protein